MKLVKNLLKGALFVAISSYIMSCSNSTPTGTTDNLSSQTTTQENKVNSSLHFADSILDAWNYDSILPPWDYYNSDTIRLIIPAPNDSASNSLGKNKATTALFGGYYEVLLIPIDKRYTDGITVMVKSVGVLSLDFLFKCDMYIYNVNNEKVKAMNLRDAIFKSKTYNFQISMSNSVVEKISIENVWINGNYTHFTTEGYRYQQIGGAYSNIPANGGERHHCFASSIYDNTIVYKYDRQGRAIGTVSATYGAPCVLMTSEDHRKTKSCGSSEEAKLYRAQQLELVKQGKYLDAMLMDVKDIHSISYGGRYDEGLKKMINYATDVLGW